MKYRAIPILSFLFLPTLLTFAYAQPQIGEKTPGFITSTLEGQRIALKDYWEQQGKKVLALCAHQLWEASTWHSRISITRGLSL